MPIQKTKSSVAATALGPAMVMLLASCCRPKVKGGPINLSELRAVSPHQDLTLCFDGSNEGRPRTKT